GGVDLVGAGECEVAVAAVDGRSGFVGGDGAVGMVQGLFAIAQKDQGGGDVVIALGCGEGEDPTDPYREFLGVLQGLAGVLQQPLQGGACSEGVVASGGGAGLDGGKACPGLRAVGNLAGGCQGCAGGGVPVGDEGSCAGDPARQVGVGGVAGAPVGVLQARQSGGGIA